MFRLYLDSPFTPLHIALVVVATIVWLLLSRKRRSQLPPGPRGWIIAGNALQIAQNTPWLTLSDWKKKYGDIVYLNIFGRPMVVINSMKVAKDLLEKRSSVYSDRPSIEMLSLVGFDRNFVLMRYCNEFRQQRKLVSQDFTPSKCPQFFSLQEGEAITLVRNIQRNPRRFIPEILLRNCSTIYKAAYGYTIQSEDDPFLKMGLKSLEDFVIATTAANFIVNFIPWLKHVPSWLPGASFQRTAKEMQERFKKATGEIMWHCKDGFVTGSSSMPNVCGNYYKAAGGEIGAGVEEQLRLATFAVLGGGLDTISNTVVSFFMAMVLNPKIQKKIQAELDSVVGNKRLPLISDKPKLPYIRSVMTETFRWAPVLPSDDGTTLKRPWFSWLNGGVGVIPRAPSQDDEYEGFFIPKGSIILPNVWQMLHDPEAYSDPMEFIPERYEGRDSEMDRVKDAVFGFGRRACPGMHFAEGTFFATVATTLATCDILPGFNESGGEVLPSYSSTTGIISLVEPFTVRLIPRSTQASSLLLESSTDHGE